MQIQAHGLNFNIEQYGLTSHRDDFERGAYAAEEHLQSMHEYDIRNAHVACLKWIDDECDGDRPELFDRLEVIAEDAATDGRASSDSVGVMISACK
jgi:hypothetical protein